VFFRQGGRSTLRTAYSRPSLRMDMAAVPVAERNRRVRARAGGLPVRSCRVCVALCLSTLESVWGDLGFLG